MEQINTLITPPIRSTPSPPISISPFSIRYIITYTVHTDFKDILLNVLPPFEKEINEQLRKEYNSFGDDHNKYIFPSITDIFRCFNQFQLDDLRCVIIGQDPYHTPEVADGLSFSSKNKYKKIPQSLRNIFKEIERCYGVFRTDPDLSDWAVQGCLMLNMSLTVLKGKPNSHSNIWNRYVKEVLTQIVKRSNGISIMLWGNYAHSVIDSNLKDVNNDRVLILKAGHPSPLNRTRPFVGCDHFVSTNKWLKNSGKDEIVWV